LPNQLLFVTESFESFKQRFGVKKNDWIKIYRCEYPNAGQKAADWAKAHYKNSDKTYLVTLNLKSYVKRSLFKLSVTK
jgi:hypothetical protein